MEKQSEDCRALSGTSHAFTQALAGRLAPPLNGYRSIEHFKPMGQALSIHNSGQEIDLKTGKYKIDVLGGWGVKLGQFSISLIHIQSGQTVNCERSLVRVQSYVFDKRAKQIFEAIIAEPGTYKVDFRNPETLKVKHTNLFFSALFQAAIPNDKISIYIH